jgi:hypothetical protein
VYFPLTLPLSSLPFPSLPYSNSNSNLLSSTHHLTLSYPTLPYTLPFTLHTTTLFFTRFTITLIQTMHYTCTLIFLISKHSQYIALHNIISNNWMYNIYVECESDVLRSIRWERTNHSLLRHSSFIFNI